MIEFILNNEKIETTQNAGMALLDFIRKDKQLKGTKLVCKEGECGACTILVGTLVGEEIEYVSMTSCIMPLINAHRKHIVTIEGLNMQKLSPVQQAMVDAYGTQCGFCTPGFVVSLSGYLMANNKLTSEGIIASMDGNICRCTGYKSIERASDSILEKIDSDMDKISIEALVKAGYIPKYFDSILERLSSISVYNSSNNRAIRLGGGTDLYVQKPYEMYENEVHAISDNPVLNTIKIEKNTCVFGASLTMGDLSRSTLFNQALPDFEYMFKLLSSSQIRNMSTIGGNLINASPIGDFTILLLGLNSQITLNKKGLKRRLALKDFYLDYKKMDIRNEEILESISFEIPDKNSKYHFEKVSQRRFFDIASVNFASHISLKEGIIQSAHLAIGGVAAIPLYLKKTGRFLEGKYLDRDLIDEAKEILQTEISPISDARGTAEYKRLLARQLFLAQFLRIDPNLYQIKKLIGQ